MEKTVDYSPFSSNYFSILSSHLCFWIHSRQPKLSFGCYYHRLGNWQCFCAHSLASEIAAVIRFMFCTPGPASDRGCKVLIISSTLERISTIGVIAERILRCASSKPLLKVHICWFYQLLGRFVMGFRQFLTRFCIKCYKFGVQNAHKN